MNMNEITTKLGKAIEINNDKLVELGFELANLSIYIVEDIAKFLNDKKSTCLNFYELKPLFEKYGYETTIKYFKKFFVKEGEEKNV